MALRMQQQGAQQREGDAAAQLQPVAARQLDLLLEQLFGAPCVAPCAREAVECSATTFAKPRGVHLGACRSGDKGNERCPQRRVDVLARRARRGASAPFQPARVSPAAALRLQRWPTGAFGPHSPALGPWGRHSAPQAAARTPQASARQAIARPPRVPYLNSAVYLQKCCEQKKVGTH